MSTFADRRQPHDTLGFTIVGKHVNAHGGQLFPVGVETERPELLQAVRQLYDLTALAMRFKADSFLVIDRATAVVEIKTESGVHSNFAIEIDSLKVARDADQAGRGVCLIAGVDLARGDVRWCRASQIVPTEMLYPRGHAENRLADQRAWFPDARQVILLEPGNGSGTPYCLIPKTSRIWVQDVLTALLGKAQATLWPEPLPTSARPFRYRR